MLPFMLRPLATTQLRLGPGVNITLAQTDELAAEELLAFLVDPYCPPVACLTMDEEYGGMLLLLPYKEDTPSATLRPTLDQLSLESAMFWLSDGTVRSRGSREPYNKNDLLEHVLSDASLTVFQPLVASSSTLPAEGVVPLAETLLSPRPTV